MDAIFIRYCVVYRKKETISVFITSNLLLVFAMSAIKRFFEKKKTDAKFKIAGGGQKLGDAAAAETAAQKRAATQAATQNRAGGSGTSRGQLTQEKRLAAAAALDR